VRPVTTFISRLVRAWFAFGSHRFFGSAPWVLLSPSVSRFSQPPEPIASVTEHHRRRLGALEGGQDRPRRYRPAGTDRSRAAGWHLVRGEIVGAAPALPPLATLLPYGLDAAVGVPVPSPPEPTAPESGERAQAAERAHESAAVLVRADLEERLTGLVAPLGSWGDRERVDRARDLVIADATGPALVRLADGSGRLHPDVELHLAGPVRHLELPARWDEAGEHQQRDAWLRLLRLGDPVYVLGRVAVAPGLADLAALAEWTARGYREPPGIAVFAGAAGPLHLFDEAAFRQRADWEALPIFEKAYRKMSAWIRTRW
jgi:hypothetical protein